MASIITADNGVVSGSAGIKSSADSSGVLALASGTGTTAVTIDTSQNVGIGTSSPSYRLDVQGNGDVYAHVRNNTSGSGAARLLLTNNGDSGFGIINNSGASGVVNLLNYKAAPMAFWTDSAERMRIDTSGNLLVGASSLISSERLGVTQTSASGQCSYYYNSNASFANYMQLMNTARAASSAFSFIGCYAAGASKFSVDGNGSIAASTAHSLTSSSNELNLCGVYQATGDVYVNYRNSATTISNYRFMNGQGLGAYASCVAVAFTPSSDYRIKTDVQDEPVALEKVLALRPVNYVKDGAPAREHGLIAHEVSEIFPDLVGGEGKDAVDDEGDMVIQTVNYMGLTSILVKAIQEQQALINNLTERLAALEGAQA